MPGASTSRHPGEPNNAKGVSSPKTLSQSSITEHNALRARCFPNPRLQLSTSVHLSHRPSEKYDTLLFINSNNKDAHNKSMDDINDHTVCGLFHSVCTTPPAVDPFMTLICPENHDAVDDSVGSFSETESKLFHRDNFGRTQVRVEGYFRDSNDTLCVLIPNDLPRSTFLYVLTASEGRDKLFKCLQYGLHLAICLIKGPSLLPLDSQEFTDYWADRLWRNCNTIRHGRNLFKLGRWLMNIFYLEEVLERLALKYGNVWKGLLRTVASFISQLRHLSPGRPERLCYNGGQGMLSSMGSIGFVNRVSAESLVTDDMYTHIARAEFPWHQLGTSQSMGARMGVAGVKLRKEKEGITVKSTLINTLSPTTAAVGHAVQESRKAGVMMEQSENRSYLSDVMTDSALPCESLTLPPSVQSTLPASLAFDGGHHFQHHRQGQLSPLFSTKLLRPLHGTGGDDDNNNSNGNNNMKISDFRQKLSLRCNSGHATGVDKSNPSCGYFAFYQMLPYESRLGDALPSPRVTGITAHSYSAGKVHTGRSKPSAVMDDGDVHEEPFELQQVILNDSEASLTLSYSGDVTGDDTGVYCPARTIPAEMGHPARWRRRVLDFSTPLLLLLGVRSIATIGRRMLRDILLLSSEHFLNLSCVEKNRPLLQRHTNWMWLIVASIDVLLNTIRLFNPGWYKYTTVVHNARYRCNCSDTGIGDAIWRYRDLVARRQTNLFFPSVDLDFGAPICSSPAYFEAAEPVRIAPACRACGCLFVETKTDGADDSSGQELCGTARVLKGVGNDGHRGRGVHNGSPLMKPFSIGDKAEVAILFIPWLMRRVFNYLWMLRTHPNWTATVLLQVRYMMEVYLAFMYCFGGYETGKSDASVEDMLHPSGAIAGLVGAVIGLYRVVESAPR